MLTVMDWRGISSHHKCHARLRLLSRDNLGPDGTNFDAAIELVTFKPIKTERSYLSRGAFHGNDTAGPSPALQSLKHHVKQFPRTFANRH